MHKSCKSMIDRVFPHPILPFQLTKCNRTNCVSSAFEVGDQCTPLYCRGARKRDHRPPCNCCSRLVEVTSDEQRGHRKHTIQYNGRIGSECQDLSVDKNSRKMEEI